MQRIESKEKKKEKSENDKKTNIKLKKKQEERKNRGRKNEILIFSPKKHHVYLVTFGCDFLKTTNAVFNVGKNTLAFAISDGVTPLYFYLFLILVWFVFVFVHVLCFWKVWRA